jgi:MtrB/PioB family decaheme-associated outer membrane protein
MQTDKKNLRLAPLTLAVRSTLASLAILALAPAARADDGLSALISPTNYLEFGGTYVEHASDAFGQYNGLNQNGGSLIGDVGLSGGNAYGEQGGTRRWSITGTDLGTTSRSVDLDAADQGSWELGLSYDQLRNYGGDSTSSNPGSMQTPLQGAMGGNTFTLPPGFGSIDETKITGHTYGTQTLTAGQQAFFHTESLYTERDTTGFTAKHDFGPNLNLGFEWTNIKQSGAVLTGAVTSLGTVSPTPTATPANQDVLYIPDPTDFNTNNFDLSLNWAGEKGYFTVAYFGSQFRDNYNGVYFANPYTKTVANGGAIDGGNYPMDMEGTAPSNADNQIKFSGGYDVANGVKLVGGYSYGRNTQNMAYAYEPAMLTSAVPVASLNGVVVNQNGNWRLTDRASNDLTLGAGMVYNKRDNQTASYEYNYITPSNDDLSAWNAPMSNSKLDSDVSADYRFTPTQRLHVDVQNEAIKRWCDNAAANVVTVAPGGIAAYTTDGCAEVPQSSENKLIADYRAALGDTLDVNAGVGYADRHATINTNFYNPIQSAEPAEDQGLENPGYMAYFDASRNEGTLKAGVNWQPTNAWDVSLDGNFANDQYTDSALGVQNGHRANVNLEGDYRLSDDASVSAYASWQRQTRGLLSQAGSLGESPTSGKSPGSEYDWFNSLADQGTTFGITAQRKGLMADKLSLKADLSYSIDSSNYASNVVPGSGPTAAAVIVSCAAPGTAGQTCGAVPEIRNQITQLRLSGDYDVDSRSSIIFGYVYAHLNSNDYMYAAQQMGFTPTAVLPTNEVGPSYTQNAVYIAYRYQFQ